jgi:CDP-glucose 4,6-dehydratase
MTNLSTFYRHKTVLITGHTGFKGWWLATWLDLLGSRVVGFSLPPSDMESDRETAGGVTSRYGDIREMDAVRAVVAECQPEIVFHLAAQALVRRSYRAPVETYATNVMGTVHLLEAARKTPSVRAVVNVTSDKCYENREWAWGYRETEPMGGHDPYSSSKGCAELVTAAYRRSFAADRPDLAIGSARAGNVIGGGDWAEDRIVPDIIRALTAHQPVVLRRPHAVRPWQHVLEPLRGYLMLGERLYTAGQDFADGWNFGPAEVRPLTVLELTRQLLAIWGSGQVVVQEDGGVHEAHYLKLDCCKAHQQLGWWPLLSVEDALVLTAQWYRAHAANHRGDTQVIRRQIHDYMARMSYEVPLAQPSTRAA